MFFMIGVPDAELFTIRLHYKLDEIEGFAGYIDYCCADQMSKIELVSMAKEFGLDIEGFSIGWLDARSGVGVHKEIRTDLEALEMAMSVGCSREIYVCITLPSGVNVSNDATVGLLKYVEEDEDQVMDDAKLEEIITGGKGKGRNVDDEEDFHDSDYSFSDRSEEEIIGNEGRRQEQSSNCGEAAQLGIELDEESDYDDSDALQSASSTDEEELAPSRARYPEFNGEVDMKNPQFKIGMKFRDFKQFKEAVRNYGIRNRYVMNFRPNTKKKCKAFCKRGCPFYLWASPMVGDKNTVQIKTGVFEHECSRDHNNRHVNANWIAMNYLEQFRADPNWAISGIVQAVKTNQEVNISRLKAYRAKCIAHRMIDGDEESQILRLHDYRLELMKTHPGSTIIIECKEDVFERMYVCLAPLRAGFLAGCRRLVSLDGCWLKGLYGGQLLSAVGIDANDCIYPIAWAVVSRETKDSWTKFLQVLAQDLRISDSQQWAFMSDRQKGLMPAIYELFPNSEHRYCVRHIHTNFKKTYRVKALKDQLWSCAKATYLSAYEKAMEGLKGMSLGAFEYMKRVEPKHWSRSHFHTQFKCDILLNNLCEVFNSQILEARVKGIITMNEMIRTQLMKRIQKRRDAMQNVKTTHCPKILKKLEKSKQLSWFYNSTWSGGDKYQVVGPDGQFVVNKAECKCSCRRWQLSGIPCSHSISVLYYNREKPEDYIHPCYRVSTFMATYTHILYPTHDKDSWPKSDQVPIIPPQPINRRRGRKTMLRRKELGETSAYTKGKVSKKGVKMTCSICGAQGHNKRFHGVQQNNTTQDLQKQQQQHTGPCPGQTSLGVEILAKDSQKGEASNLGKLDQLKDLRKQQQQQHTEPCPSQTSLGMEIPTRVSQKGEASNLGKLAQSKFFTIPVEGTHGTTPCSQTQQPNSQVVDIEHMQAFDVGSYRNADEFSRPDMVGERCKNPQSLLPQIPVKEVAWAKKQTSTPAMETHSYGRKPTTKSSTTQVKTKDGGESNKPGGDEKRRKIWLPPGIGGYSGSADPYKKHS